MMDNTRLTVEDAIQEAELREHEQDGETDPDDGKCKSPTLF